jgi:hypothetical protein
VKQHSDAPLLGRLLALPTNWKGLPGTNALAYCKRGVNYEEKRFITFVLTLLLKKTLTGLSNINFVEGEKFVYRG